MQKPLPKACLLSEECLREFNPHPIQSGLGALRPDNFLFMIASRKFPGNWNMKERWYGTEYRYEKIPVDFMNEIKSKFDDGLTRQLALHLPSRNEFLPLQLEVKRHD